MFYRHISNWYHSWGGVKWICWTNWTFMQLQAVCKYWLNILKEAEYHNLTSKAWKKNSKWLQNDFSYFLNWKHAEKLSKYPRKMEYNLRNTYRSYINHYIVRPIAILQDDRWVKCVYSLCIHKLSIQHKHKRDCICEGGLAGRMYIMLGRVEW